jgi:hypothetical protein
MFNHNSFKTALTFLSIIFVVIVINLFLTEDKLFVKNNAANETASVNCLNNTEIC